MNLQKQYDTALAAWKELAPEQLPPALGNIEAALTDKQRAYIEQHNGELVMTPALSLYELIERFDKKQTEKTYVYHELWDQYEFGSRPRVDFLLPETKFTNQTYEEQKKSLQKEIKSCKRLQSIDPRMYVVAQTIHRDNMLNQDDWLRLVQLPMKTVDGDSYVANVFSSGEQLFFGRSYGLRNLNDGLGVSVALKFNTQTSSFPHSLDFWRDIPGYEGKYEVSQTGEVKNKRSGRILALNTTSRGYKTIVLENKSFRIHRLVLITFKGICPDGYQVNHIDGNKNNNNLNNLEYVTNQENHDHAVETGLLDQKGESNTNAKLTAEDVRDILYSLSLGETLTEIAKKFNVSRSTVSNIKTGRRWNSLPEIAALNRLSDVLERIYHV